MEVFPFMEVWLVSAAGTLGLLIGSFLTKVIWRVPRGESLRAASHCPNCDTPLSFLQKVPIASWVAVRGQCASCGKQVGAHYPLVELCTAAAFALITWWALSTFGWPTGPAPEALAWWLTLAGFLWFAAASIALTAIDVEHQRLPNSIVLPSLGVVTATLTCAALLVGDWSRLISTLGGGVMVFALYLVIALLSPRGMGGGDVKLALLTGLVLGYLGWTVVAVGTFLGFVLGALWSLLLIVRRRATRKSRIPFGPFMLLGVWITLVWFSQA